MSVLPGWECLYYQVVNCLYYQVVNVLPTVSAAIALRPQCYIWRTLIALHTSPRILFAMAFYRWHMDVDVGELFYTIPKLISDSVAKRLWVYFVQHWFLTTVGLSMV